jgi:hypothetical protein
MKGKGEGKEGRKEEGGKEYLAHQQQVSQPNCVFERNKRDHVREYLRREEGVAVVVEVVLVRQYTVPVIGTPGDHRVRIVCTWPRHTRKGAAYDGSSPV